MWFRYCPRRSLSEQLQDVPGSPPAQLTHALICHFPALLQFLRFLPSYLKTTVTNETFLQTCKLIIPLSLQFFFFFFFSWWLNSFVANPNRALHAYCIIYSSALTDSCICHTLHPLLHSSAPWEWLVPMQKGQKASGKPKCQALDWAGGFTKGRDVHKHLQKEHFSFHPIQAVGTVGAPHVHPAPRKEENAAPFSLRAVSHYPGSPEHPKGTWTSCLWSWRVINPGKV